MRGKKYQKEIEIKQKQIHVIIPIFHVQTSFIQLLNTIKAQSIKCNVLILDSGNKPEITKKIKKHGCKIKKIKVKSFDHGGTRQLAIEECKKSNIYIFLTQDVALSCKDTLSQLLAPFKDKSVGAVSGRQLPHRNATVFAKHARFFSYPSNSNNSLLRLRNKGLGRVNVSNSFAAYRAEALRDVGGFPQKNIFGEDMYVAAKMIQRGWRVVYNPKAICYHSHNYSMLEEFKRYFDIGVFHARNPWIRRDFGGAEGRGLDFVKSEIKYLIRIKSSHLICESILRSGIKYFAFKLGANERLIPNSIKMIVSMNKTFWQKYKCRV